MSTLIFGIINICFGIMKLGGPLAAKVVSNLKLPGNAGLAALKSDPDYIAWTNISLALGVVLGLALLAFGIGLLLLKNWARVGSIVYAVIDIVLVPIGAVVGWRFMGRMALQTPGAPAGLVQGFAVIGLAVGIIIGLAYPVLLLFFMTRPNVIEACQPEQPEQPVAPAQG